MRRCADCGHEIDETPEVVKGAAVPEPLVSWKLGWACPYYGPTNPIVGDSQRANVMNTAAVGHVWVEDFSTNGMQHRTACENMWRAAAKDQRIDALLWTEHDVVLPPDAVQKLIAAAEAVPEADVVTGIVFRRCAPYTPMVSFLNEDLTPEQYEEYKKSPLVNVAKVANTYSYEEMKRKFLTHLDRIDTEGAPFRCGTASMGCLLFRKRALPMMVDVPELFAVDPHGFFSIDNAFFLKCRDQGLKLYCNPSILCGHLGDPEIVGWQQWKKFVERVVETHDSEKTERIRRGVPGTRIYGELTRLANKHRSDKGTLDHQAGSGWTGWIHNYCDFYESQLAPIRQTAGKVLEIGVFKGGSLRMWRDYFPNAFVFGMDNKEEYLISEDRIVTGLGDQGKREDLEGFIWAHGSGFDLIVDDGCHFMKEQQVSLGFLFQHLRPGGFYILEDLFTSFMGESFGVEGDGANATILVIEALAEGRMPDSKYLTDEELFYLHENVASCTIYGKKSLTCVIRKKEAE